MIVYKVTNNSIGEASRWAVENLSIRTNNPRNARIPIMDCCKGKYEKAYGYKWKYLSG